ncbi:MAG TPA: ABC transporter ATP-binding protein [Microbacteriaceae bacterium]|nr:ABC transporter ATP-binding protein [Microbacteriaceae bacterium]
MASLVLKGLAVGYPEGSPVVSGIDLVLPDAGVTAVLGTNGSGKSTLLKTIARILRPLSGAAILDGQDIHHTPTKELARRLAILGQDPPIPRDMTVRELVAYGRSPHRRPLRAATDDDRARVADALEATGTVPLADTPLDRLSGGQRQRAWIAMALAQDAPTILLDEPTSFLDIEHQLEVLLLLRGLADTRGKQIVMVVHDIDQALGYADHVVVLHEGRVVAAGPPGEVLTPELILRVFHVRAVIRPGPGGRAHCLPYALAGREPRDAPWHV